MHLRLVDLWHDWVQRWVEVGHRWVCRYTKAAFVRGHHVVKVLPCLRLRHFAHHLLIDLILGPLHPTHHPLPMQLLRDRCRSATDACHLAGTLYHFLLQSGKVPAGPGTKSLIRAPHGFLLPFAICIFFFGPASSATFSYAELSSFGESFVESTTT